MAMSTTRWSFTLASDELPIADLPARIEPFMRGGDDWATPWQFVRELEREFGPFDLDPCATPRTAKAARFYTIEDDGPSQPWTGRVFCNPPYSNKELWLSKAIESAKAGATVFMLLPASTETAWFHDLVLPHASEVRFLRGRIRFLGYLGTEIPQPRNGSMLVIYRP